LSIARSSIKEGKTKKTKQMNITKVITEESQAPQGYIRICEMARGNEEMARQISRLHNSGAVPAVKLMRSVQDRTGPVWVCKKTVEAMLQSEKQAVPVMQAVFELDASANLQRIADLTEKTYHTMEAILQSMKKIETYSAAAAIQ
jgi:hypothetical protein